MWGPLPGELTGKRGRSALEITVESTAANRTVIAPTSLASGGWGSRAALPEPNSEMGVVWWNWKIYVIGGYLSTGMSINAVQECDTATDRWRLATPLPVP